MLQEISRDDQARRRAKFAKVCHSLQTYFLKSRIQSIQGTMRSSVESVRFDRKVSQHMIRLDVLKIQGSIIKYATGVLLRLAILRHAVRAEPRRPKEPHIEYLLKSLLELLQHIWWSWITHTNIFVPIHQLQGTLLLTLLSLHPKDFIL